MKWPFISYQFLKKNKVLHEHGLGIEFTVRTVPGAATALPD
jgi:hypothetical protein